MMTTTTFLMTALAVTGVGVGEALGAGVGVGVGVSEDEVDEPLTPPQPIMRARNIGLTKNKHTRLKILNLFNFVNKHENKLAFDKSKTMG